MNPKNTDAIERIKQTKALRAQGMTAMEANNARKSGIQPTVSASELVNPPSNVTPPVPQMNTNDGSRTSGLIENTATNTQNYITAQSEEAKKRDELASLMGNQTFNGAEERARLGGEYGLPQNMTRLQDIQTQLAKANTASGITKAKIAGGAGQTMAQGQRELTQEDRENAVRNAGLAAEANVLQENIETAGTLINQAMSDYYSDRQMENQNKINQLNYYSGIVDEQTKQLVQKETRKYEEDQVRIQQAMNSVNSAIATGIASTKDVETMTALSGNPQAQKEYADKIIATSARGEYQRRIEAVNMAKQQAVSIAKDEAEANAIANAVSTQATVDAVANIRNNPLGIKAITGSTWLGRTALSAGLETGGTQGFLGGSALGFAGGSVVPGLGNVAGGALGGTLGFLGGLGVGSAAAASQRTNVASDLSYLVNDATFSEMRRLKQTGVTFGSLTEGERVAIGRAADALFSALDVAPDGTVNGVKTTEKKFYTLLDNYEQKRVAYQEELNRTASGLTPEDYQEIENAGL